MIEAILFDYDGVIVDSEKINYEANQMAFNKYGISLSKQEFIQKWIIERTSTLGMIHDNSLRISSNDFRNERKQFYEMLYEKAELMPYAKQTIQLLHEKYKLGIASSNQIHAINLGLNKFKLKKYFEIIISSEDVKNLKPNPEPYLKAAKALNVNPKNCLVIEDSEGGVISAKKAGAKCIAIPCEYTKDQNFQLADLTLKNLGEINLEIMEKLSTETLLKTTFF